jgi:uncharacterized membrane protein
VNTLTIWSFPDPGAAEEALVQLQSAVRAESVTVGDAALVSWPLGRRTPTTRDLGSITGPGQLWGGFWGMLHGLIFLTPLAGPAFGAAAGAVAGTLSDFGVQDDFVLRARESVTPGTSAIFLLSSRASADMVARGLGQLGVETLRAELSAEQEHHLIAALGDR